MNKNTEGKTNRQKERAIITIILNKLKDFYALMKRYLIGVIDSLECVV